MLTINTILRDIKNIPINRLDEVYQFVHSLAIDAKQNDVRRKKILSFGGAFSNMSDEDYNDFRSHTTEARTSLFNRNVEL